MILSFDLPVTVMADPPFCRERTQVLAAHAQQVDIPHLSVSIPRSAELRIAGELFHIRSELDAAHRYVEVDQYPDTDKLYRFTPGNLANALSSGRHRSALRRQLNAGQQEFLHFNWPEKAYEPLKHLSAMRYSNPDEWMLERQLESQFRLLDDLVLIDGTLCRRIDGPFIMLGSWQQRSWQIALDFDDRRDGTFFCYPVTEIDTALKAGASISVRYKVPLARRDLVRSIAITGQLEYDSLNERCALAHELFNELLTLHFAASRPEAQLDFAVGLDNSARALLRQVARVSKNIASGAPDPAVADELFMMLEVADRSRALDAIFSQKKFKFILEHLREELYSRPITADEGFPIHAF